MFNILQSIDNLLHEIWVGRYPWGDKQETESDHNLTNFKLAKLRLASYPHATTKVLRKLARQNWPELLQRVAENSHTHATVLETLSQHSAPEVRVAVADNQNTPVKAIQCLAHDESTEVRFVMAENPHTPTEILEKLAQDENPYVADRARKTLEKLKFDH